MYCPHCNAEIDHLRYESRITSFGTEWGTCNTDGEDQDSDDSETNDTEYGDTTYYCPECDDEVTPEELMDEQPEDEDEDEEDSEDQNEYRESRTDREIVNIDDLTDGGTRIRNTDNSVRDHINSLIRTVKCPSCQTENILTKRGFNEQQEKIIICSECNEEIIL